MKKYIAIEADNLSFDLFASKVFDTDDEASQILYKSYQEILEDNEWNGRDVAECTKRYYQIIFTNGDTYYGQVREIEV